MKLILLVFFVIFLNTVFAQEASNSVKDSQVSSEITKSKFNEQTTKELSEAYARFKAGSYEAALNALETTEANYQGQQKEKLLGLLSYWRGIIYSRLQDYETAKVEFIKSYNYKYRAQDFFYEFAQTLYALDELKQSRDMFMRSALANYRPAISLYYVAFISQTLREFRTAIKAYRRIEKLKDPEKEEVMQASKMQIADIYLTAADKQLDQVSFLQKRVIKEFEEALVFDPDSNLSRDIRRKILSVQDKYGLILLKMRNGRPTIFPRGFMKFSQDISYDTNALLLDESTLSSSERGSVFFSKSDFYARRVFYSGNSVSIAPEIRLNYTHYVTSIESKEELNNWTGTVALRNAFEHWMWGKPASVLLDVDFNHIERNLSNDGLSFNSRSTTYMLGERFNLFNAGETILRLRYKDTVSYTEANNSTTTSLVAEQMLNSETGYILLLNLDYSQLRVETDSFDTNSYAARFDLITPRVFGFATPTFGFGYTYTDVINDSSRGTETLLNPSFKLTKVVNPATRINLKFDYYDSVSNSTTYTYNRSVTTLGLEYIF